MPDYTIVNLLEMDDTVDGKVPGLEGGSAASTCTRGISA
jgi:hypothetical protein